jgi:NAD(P)-dependent dehydrogenase (short-subunit alcohol dehydrogenase family)
MRAVRPKLLGPVFAIQEATKHLRSNGSITLTSGIAALRPIRGGTTATAINGAVEGLGRALAIELAHCV